MYIALTAIFALIIILLFLIYPGRNAHKHKKMLKNAYVAHRGLHSDTVPENSLKAFKMAIDGGYMIENDIRLTKDGQVVVFHDDNLLRMCGVDKRVDELTLGELKELRLKNSDEQIPTLKECLDLVDGRVAILIEFKCVKKTESDALCAFANEILSNYNGVYFMQSFYPFAVEWYKKNRPDILRGVLASGFYKEKTALKLVGSLVFNFLAKPHFISYDHTNANNVFRRVAVKMGALSVGWTFKSQAEINKNKNNFEAFIFEQFIPEE